MKHARGAFAIYPGSFNKHAWEAFFFKTHEVFFFVMPEKFLNENAREDFLLKLVKSPKITSFKYSQFLLGLAIK